MRNTFLTLIAIVGLAATSALAQSVTITSPAAGATVSSPVNVSASTSAGAYPIDSMRLYVDNQSVTTVTGSSLSASPSLSAGNHSLVVVAWDRMGTAYSKSETVTVGTSSGTTTPTAPVTTSGGVGVTISSPANGASVASPVQFAASATANAGQTITAMRVYVDSNSMYTVGASSLSTSLSLATGNHNVVIVAWDSTGTSYTSSETISVGATSSSSGSGSSSTGSTGSGSGTTSSGAVGVTISSPANGASVASPVQFAASATGAAGQTITAMRVYVDNNSMFTGSGSSLNTSVSLGTGNHNVVIVAWDNTGASYKSGETISVGSGTTSSGGGSGSTGGSTGSSGGSGATSTTYQNDFNGASQWIATQALPSGAIMYSTERINPYFANLGMQGAVKDPKNYALVQNWMQWYINHLNWPDQWGLYGTVYDYNIVNGQEVSSGDADSTDSYAATFVSLAHDYYMTGDANAQAYIKGISYQLDSIGGVMLATQQADGLTWAKPNYEMKYLMDNCEVYRGLQDLADLFGAEGDTARQQKYAAAAAANKAAILTMWMGDRWAVYKDWYGNNIGPDMTLWYPDASAQVFPVLYQVLPGSDSRAQAAYNLLNSSWPGWPQMSYSAQDDFPWVMVGAGAALMGDTGRTGQFISSLEQKYVSQGFPWTWYNMENGWFMRMTNYMDGARPF